MLWVASRSSMPVKMDLRYITATESNKWMKRGRNQTSTTSSGNPEWLWESWDPIWLLNWVVNWLNFLQVSHSTSSTESSIEQLNSAPALHWTSYGQPFHFSGNYIMSRLHGLFYGALLCALFGVTPSLYMGTVTRDGNLTGIPIYFLTYQFINKGNSTYTTDRLIQFSGTIAKTCTSRKNVLRNQK